MSDRTGDDLHEGDTRQEMMSLSARFGLTVTFQQPDKARFDAILLDLAKQYKLQMPSDQTVPARRSVRPARGRAAAPAWPSSSSNSPPLAWEFDF